MDIFSFITEEGEYSWRRSALWQASVKYQMKKKRGTEDSESRSGWGGGLVI